MASFLLPLTFVSLSVPVFAIGLMVLRRRSKGHPDEDADPTRWDAFLSTLAAAVPIREKKLQRMRQEVVQAGFYHAGALDCFLATRNVALMSWAVLLAAVLAWNAEAPVELVRSILLVGGVVLVLIFGLPPVWLRTRAAVRRNRIHYSLPDALDMLTMMVTGGLSLPGAIERVSREIRRPHPDLAAELCIVQRQAEMGSLPQALRKFADRIDLPDVRGLTAMVQHAERLGSPLGAALAEYADGVRRARRQRAEERGNQRSVMLLFPVIGLLTPPIYILLLGPALLELRNFVNRENRPGGVLTPAISAAAQQRPVQITRDDTARR